MIFFACLPLFLSQAGAFTQRITLEEPCISAPKLLEKMSSASGSKLVADDDVLNDLIAMRVDGRPVSELMAHLADAEGSDWVLIGSTYHLKRSQAKIRAAHREVFTARLRAISRTLQDFKKEVSNEPAFDARAAQALADFTHKMEAAGDDVEKFNQINQLSRPSEPSQIAFAKVLLQFSPEQLASLPTEPSVIYSSRPTRLELPFPDQVADIIAEFIPEQELFNAVVKSEPVAAGNEGASLKPRSLKGLDHVLLEFEPDNSDINASLLFVDGGGTILESEQQDLKIDAIDEADAKPSDGVSDVKWQPLPLTPLEKENRRIFLLEMLEDKPDASKPPSETIKSALLHPDRVPAASLFWGPILLRSAQNLGRNFCAVLNDEMTALGPAAATPKGFDLGQIQLFSKAPGQYNFKSGNGWITIGPKKFDEVQEQRIDLAALANFCQAASAAGRIEIESESLFAAQSSEACFENNTLVTSYLERLVPGGYTAYHFNDYDLLRLHAALTPDQRATTANGIQVASLSGPQKEILEHYIFFSSNVALHWGMAVGNPGLATKDSRDPRSTLLEPKESLPNGVPNDALLQITDQTDLALNVDLTPEGAERPFIVPMKLDAIAKRIFVHSKTPDARLPFTRIQPISQRTISFNIQLTKDLMTRGNLRDSSVAGSFVSDWQQLPEAYRDAIQKKIDAMK